MNQFVNVWLIFLSTGTMMAVGTVVWAIRKRQFEDQDRARYLPLVDLSGEELAGQPPIRRGGSFYALLGILVIGLAVLAITLKVVLRHAGV
jgi:hypothetical protein